MLQHVIKVKVLNLVLSGVNLLVTVLEIRLNDEGAGVASFAGASMVGARVASNMLAHTIGARSTSTHPQAVSTYGIVQYSVTTFLMNSVRPGST